MPRVPTAIMAYKQNSRALLPTTLILEEVVILISSDLGVVGVATQPGRPCLHVIFDRRVSQQAVAPIRDKEISGPVNVGNPRFEFGEVRGASFDTLLGAGFKDLYATNRDCFCDHVQTQEAFGHHPTVAEPRRKDRQNAVGVHIGQNGLDKTEVVSFLVRLATHACIEGVEIEAIGQATRVTAQLREHWYTETITENLNRVMVSLSLADGGCRGINCSIGVSFELPELAQRRPRYGEGRPYKYER
ncbi:hypothetical protein FOL46_002958 [Perkinsus olseni]|uniref:Uncharacterized protein n=1 Tax=Perkinsus olseni TaxID=32597 RepID=A0A7J6MXU4_PEROL|nr:hypothetical protein FOL46_002958 [Perkinsus olseni]